MESLRVLILAGGSGTRFWPASRRHHPKHLVELLPGGKTLLRATVERVSKLPGNPVLHVLTAEDQRKPVAEDLARGNHEVGVLAEPAARNTGPALVWGVASLLAAGTSSDAPVVVLPSDAWVDDSDLFCADLQRAAQVACGEGGIVTIGIRPDRPATGYGYLEVERGSNDFVEGRVLRFCEKPTIERAQRFVAGGSHLWNAGIFVFTPRNLRACMRAVAPALETLCASLIECFEGGALAQAEALYREAVACSFDYAVMEQAPSVSCVAAQFSWSDLGSWDAIGPLLDVSEGGLSRAASLVAQDAEDNIVFAPGKDVGLLGIKDLIVVAVDDAVLVARKDDAQAVKALTVKLRAMGREDLL